MEEIFLIIACGGQYEDRWSFPIRAVRSDRAAVELIDKLYLWENIISKTPLPDHLNQELILIDGVLLSESEKYYDPEFWTKLAADIAAWKIEVLNKLEVPEVDRQWLLDTWDDPQDDFSGYYSSSIILG